MQGELEGLARFGIGIAGAAVVYIVMYRESRLAAFAQDPAANWKLLVVDVFLFLMAGGLVATFALEDPEPRAVFLAGGTWQGLVGGMMSGSENKELRREMGEQSEKLKAAVELIARKTLGGAPMHDEDEDVQAFPAD